MTSLAMWIGVVLTAASLPLEAAAWWDAKVDASLDRAPARRLTG